MTEVSAWPPTQYTEPLSENFTSALTQRDVELVNRFYMGPGESLDDWQIALMRAILETYPPDWHVPELRGKLRFRDGVLVLVPRQVGKTTIIGALQFVSFLKSVAQAGARTEMGCIAQTTTNAKVLFDRFKQPFHNVPALSSRFKVTGYKGVYPKNKGIQAQFKVHAADRSEKLQSIPFNAEGGVAICLDELHLQKPESYAAIKLGLSAQQNTIMVSISTAGDENSTTLHQLEQYGNAAIAGEHERFGFFNWYAPDTYDPYDPDAVRMANPAVACGRLSAENAMDRTIPEHEYTRYILNRTGQSENVFMPANVWIQAGGEMPPHEAFTRPIIAVERTENHEYVTFTAAKKIDNIIYTQVIAQLQYPEHDYLVKVCKQLYKEHRAFFVFDAQSMRELHVDLRHKHHIPLEFFNASQMAQATATTYALATTDRLVHNNDQICTAQRPHVMTKSLGDGYRISAHDSTGDIDAFKATVMCVYWAEATNISKPHAITI